MAKIKIFSFESKNKLVVRSIEIKEEATNVMFLLKKKHINGEKHIAPVNFP